MLIILYKIFILILLDKKHNETNLVHIYTNCYSYNQREIVIQPYFIPLLYLLRVGLRLF